MEEFGRVLQKKTFAKNGKKWRFFASEASYHRRPQSGSNQRWPRCECILTTFLARKFKYFCFVSNHRSNCYKMRLHKSNFEFFSISLLQNVSIVSFSVDYLLVIFKHSEVDRVFFLLFVSLRVGVQDTTNVHLKCHLQWRQQLLTFGSETTVAAWQICCPRRFWQNPSRHRIDPKLVVVTVPSLFFLATFSTLPKTMSEN